MALAAASSVLAQNATDAGEPTIAVTGVGRVLIAPDRAIVSLGASIEREAARDAQRELDAVMRAAVSAIRELGVAAENLQTSTLSLQPVYAEPPDVSAQDVRRRNEPRIVAYRATNIVHVTIEDVAMVGIVIDAGIEAGVNEIRQLSFRLADDLPYRVTAIERAVEAARQKARAAASALGVQLAEPLEIRERSVPVPYADLDATFARSAGATPIEAGEIEIEATVDVTFRIYTGPVARGD
jgi:uncharacterized protein